MSEGRSGENAGSQPRPGELRRFGLVLAVAIVVLFGILLPLLRGTVLPWWPWLPGALLLCWSTMHPQSLAPVYRFWMGFGRIMGRITTPIVLALVFFLAVLPTAIVRRAFGHDSMRRRFEPDAASYRIASRPRDPRDMEKPY